MDTLGSIFHLPEGRLHRDNQHHFMRYCFSFLLVLLCAFVVELSATAQTPAPDLKNPDALYAAALASNGLGGDGLKPWHLKANYDILDHQSKVVATGVFEEWWAAKDKWKRSYTGSHYSDTEYHLPQGDAHENEKWTFNPWPEYEIDHALVTPINSVIPNTTVPLKIIETDFGKLKLNCLRGDQFWGFCLEPGSTVLRFIGLAGMTTTYNNLALFQNRNTATDISIRVNDHALLNIHVLSLTSMSVEDDNVFVTNAPLTPCAGPPVNSGKWLRADDPDYPPQSRSNHERGLVILGGVIDEQGKFQDLTVLEAPTPALGNAALKAVRKWVHQPSLRNGQPIKIDTTVNILFNPGK